jgi:F-box protein 11
MRNVILENAEDTTLSFVDGSENAYLGYVSVLFNPEKLCPNPHASHYALHITDNASPLIERCLIHSSSSRKSKLLV